MRFITGTTYSQEKLTPSVHVSLVPAPAPVRHLIVPTSCGTSHPLTTVQCSTVQCSTVQYSTVQCSTVQCSAVQYSAVQCSTVQCSTVQCSTVQYSTVQCSTVQYSAVQYSYYYHRHYYYYSTVGIIIDVTVDAVQLQFTIHTLLMCHREIIEMIM